MGVMSMRLIVYLASFFIAYALICAQSIMFLFSWPLKKHIKLVHRFHLMMRKNYYWRGIIRMILESYLDFCVGIMLSLREPHYDTPSDIFDFFLTCFFVLVVIVWPIASFFLMRKNANQLDNEEF
jgi:hypothetical protein